MTRLILIRHGQSLANADNLFAGHSDFDLSDFGKRQAERAANYLVRNESVQAVYASDLLRAYHTACPIGEAFGLPVIRDATLREIFAGKWESMSFSAIAEQYPDEFRVWREDYSHARPVGGESTAEVYERIVPHILSLAKRHDGSCILIATHATVVRAFDSLAHGYTKDETGKIPFSYNASLNFYEYDNGGVSAVRTNVIEHLSDMVTALPPIINA